MPSPRNREKTLEIQRVAARLFAYDGYHSTSMRQIARELGMNQSSLYHYFRSKEDILFQLMEDAVDNALTTLKTICADILLPHEKLKKTLNFYARYYAGAPVRLILLVNEQNSLLPEHRAVLVDKQREYVRIFKEIFEELDVHGLAKAIPHSVAIFAFLGMVHYTITWYDKNGPVDLERLAGIFVEIFTQGILMLDASQV